MKGKKSKTSTADESRTMLKFPTVVIRKDPTTNI
jgi:hypothetical protein